MEKIRKNFVGYCPEQNAETEIRVDFLKHTPIGATPIYRKTSFFCKESDCTMGDECPIYESAHFQ